MVSTLNKYKNVPGITPQDLTNAVGSRDVMTHFHVDPDTLKPIVTGVYGVGDGPKVKVGENGVEGSAAPPPTGAAPAPGAPAAPAAKPRYSPKQLSGKAPIRTGPDGKPLFLRGGKYVHEDGTPVQ